MSKDGAVVPVPEDQMKFRDEVDAALTVIQIVCPAGDPRFEEYFVPLLSLAQVGLAGSTAHPELASRSLTLWKASVIAREAPQIKNRYMRQLGGWSLVLGAPVLLYATSLYLWAGSLLELNGFLFLWSACMAGVWLSFGSRKTVFTFEDLHMPEKDFLQPYIRLIFAGLLTMIIALLFGTGAVIVTLGDFSTAQITSSVKAALLVGLLCGFSEQVLSAKVAQQASTLLNFGGAKA